MMVCVRYTSGGLVPNISTELYFIIQLLTTSIPPSATDQLTNLIGELMTIQLYSVTMLTIIFVDYSALQ